MAFFGQLRLLLWKNALGIIRQPVWSLTLIIWPLIIFIIVAVTRNQFPPILRDTCYVGPRNLPSAGFFPFLQTLMCNTDSSCHNKSRLADQTISRSSGNARSQKNSPLVNLMQEGDFLKLAYPVEARRDTEELIRLLENILGSPNQGRANETSNNRNTTVGINYESLAYVQDTVNLLKRAVCTLVLPRINTTSPDVLTDAAVQFCTTNDTLFEVSLYTLNQVLTDQVLTEPDEMLSAAGVAVMLFSQLQNESVLWESLLAFPQMFSSGSEADLLSSTDALLTHIQSALRVIEKNFPQAAAPLSMAHPLLAAGINLIRYVQHWPGRAVSITLGDVVTLNNDTLSEILQQVLQGIEIPLDKAIPLTLDKAMVQSYLCENSSNPIWLTAACRTGTVDMLLSMVSPDKVAKKALLAWSRHVAPHDVSFAKGLVYSLIKDLSPGEPEGSTITRTRRSTDAQPENIEEELFLNVGHIVLNLVNALPEVDVVVQSILRSGFQSMKSVTLALNTVEELLSSFLADANNLQQTVDMLLTNQSDSSIWFDRVLDSVMKAIVKGMSSESVTCKEVLGLFEWLLPTETVEIEVWRAMICQNSSRLEQVLLMDWKPLLTQVVELYSTLKGEANFTVPLPMILSEWHQLYNSSMRFGNILYQLPERLDEEYWMNWMPENNTHDIGETLQKSVSLFLVNLGENIERSHLWPEVKDYFHMAYWILNYRPEVTTEPANCSASANLTIHCDTGFRWPVFVQAVTQALMAQSPGVLVNSLKGAVNLLQHVYGNTYKGLASLFLKQEIEGGDALSAYLINLINELNEFVQKISTLSDENINDPSVMGPLVSNLFESTGLGPLLPVILSDDPVNVSTVLHVASQLGRHNQHIFTFNESDPTMPDLQSLIVEFLSVGGNLTIPLSHIMGNSLLTYVGDIHPDKLAHVKAALQPFTNQTSAGLVETILSATELLNTLVSPNTNVADAILLYLQEIQKFIISLFRMQKIDQLLSPNGQLSMAQVTDLSLSVMDFLHLFTPEGIHNLTQMGPDAAQDTVIMKFVAVLPPEVQENATYFLQNLKKLQHQAANCPSGQNCLVGISEIFTFLDQVLDMIISGNGNDSIEVAKLSLVMTSEEDQEIASTVLSFLLPPNAVPSVVSFKEVVNFIRLAIAAPNITVTSLQNALIQSGLTFQELQMFAELAGGTDIGELLVTMLELVNVQQCFQPQDDPMVTVHCVTELVNRLSGFLMQVPSLHDNRAVLSLIPQIVNRTISDTIQANFSSSPDRILVQALNSTLSNIKTVLHQNQLNSPEIMREIRVVEGLIRFIASIDPNELFNATLMNDPVRAQTVYLQLVGWYLQKLETITRNSSASEFLQPFFQVAQMQVTIQLAQTNLSMFISNRIENLMNNLQRPVDGAGLKMIGLTSVEILDRLWDSIKMNLEYQNMIQDYQLFNESVLYSTEQQIKLYLGFIQEWMKQPSVPLVLTNMLQWGNSSVLVSERLTDIRDLMQTLPAFLSGDQQAYLSVINNITRSLNEAIMLAESGGLQSEAFTAAILKAVQTTMHLATTATGPLPHAVQENILEIVRDSLSLIVHPNMSFASSRNISLRILKRAEHIVTDIIPQEAAGFPLAIIKVITTYFRTISEGGGPDKWNELILNEMKTIQSLLPPNSTAQYYISELINITNFVLESGQGNMSLWAAFENAAEGNVSGMMSQALSSAVLEIIRTALDLLNTQTGLLPHPVQENILEIVQDSLSLILHPNMSFTSSRNISLHILKRAEHIVTDVIPQEAAGFPLAIIKVITTYFRTISGGGGPDKWNELILNEMNTIQSLLPPNSTAQYYISELINITNFILESGQGNMSLWAAFENAAEGNVSGMMSQALSSAILEIIRTALDLLNTQTGLLPHPVQENILEIVRDSLSLIVHPNMSFASSRNVSLHILKRAEHIVTDVIPQEAAGFPLAIIKVINTYFRTISGGGGPDKWNELILNEMMTVQSLLPPNSAAQYYVSVIINVTNFILESDQGNASLWTSLQNASEENLPEVMGQIGKLFGMIWPLVTGGTGSHSTAAPLEAFHHLAEVLEQMMTGRADKDTWDRFAQMLESLLWLLEDTDLWDNVPSVIPMMEKIIKNVVKTMDAENEMLTSLELPLVTLIGELTQSLNSSDFDDSLVMERMIDAIDNTVKAAQQANGTLECSQALVMWEPVREAAGLSKASLALWCELRLKPVLEAHAAAQTVYSHLNMSHVEEGPISVSAAADRIVEISQCVYKVNVNRTHAMEQLFMTLYNQISSLADITPSPEEEQEFYNQFQNMQLQDSLHFISELLDELVVLEPSLKPYTDCLLSSLGHVLKNRTVAQGSSSLQDRLQEAAVGFLRCANITSYDMAMMWGNLSSFDEASVAEAMRTILKLMVEMKIFGDDPEVYQNIQQLLKSPEANLMIDEIAEMAVWLLTTEASGPDLLHVALAKISDIIRPAMSLLTKTSEPQNAKLIEGLVENALAMLHRLLSTGGFLPPMDHQPGGLLSGMTGNHHQMRVRQRRDVQMKMMREPMDYFLDLLYIDYPTMFKALSVVPTPEDILETAHVFFSNPDLSVVVNGVMNDLQLGWNNTAERTVDATLGVLSYLTVPHLFDRSSLRTLANAVNMLPVGFPFSSAIKQLTRALANESQENLMLMPRTFQTMAALLQISPSDPLFKKQLEQLNFQVCVLEGMESVRLLMQSLSVQPGQLCHSILPGLQTLLEGLLMDPSTLSDIVFQAVVGDPKTYKVHANWTSAFTQSLDLDMDSLRSLRANATSPGTVTVGEMLRNKTAFVLDVERHMMFDRRTLDRLTETKLPNSNLEILSWFTKLRCSNSTASAQTDAEFLQTFCSMSVLQWYRFSVLMARRINFEKLIYRMALPEEAQTLVGAMLQMAEFITDSMTTILPAVSQLQTYLRSIEDLNLLANNEFHQMSRGQRSSISTQATFVTLSRALCSNGILALFGISQLPVKSESDPSSFNTPEREEMIERFKLPRNATPFCMNMYLDMVNTTGGAIAWAFLKPMLMGQILYTPDTPTTRAIMEKANDTLQEFADLRKHSQEWLRSSKYIVDSAKVLGHTLPMLQNSLGNSFVKNFIEMQTDINVGRMKETLSTFSNMTLLLEKNKHILKQISALSTLMVDLSSCIKFDRYRGYDSADQLNAEAQALAKSRDLYASVIFKLPNDEDASREREARSSSSNSTLPPRVSYTIRMHMDNVMRTDRVRNPYFVKDSHISSRLTMRYNRGFVYLQENIDRAIIEIHAGHKVTDLAVQIQPFPYPCYFRDAYLEAISFVFPIMLMIAWVLFVADFVKKLVHERELRLHEYMKMMGVNPFSHFFAWFLECTFYLVLTIFILTMLLKYGKILPHSDASLIFVYFCDYGLSIIAFSYMVSSFFDKTYIAGLSGSLLYILCFFPFIVVMAMETGLTFVQKSLLSLFSPTCFSYASQYASRYESQGEGIHWSNSYVSPIAEDTSSFGWLCWLMLIDSILYFIIGAYIRMVFPGKYGIPAPWYFPFQRSFWADLCCCFQSQSNKSKGLFFSNIIQSNQPVFSDDKGKSRSALTSEAAEDFSDLPVGVALHGLTKLYGNQAAIENLNVSFYEGHVTSLLGHNGAGKTTTMSLLTGLFAPSSGTIEVYGRDMQANIDKIRKELGVCMQYDVLFDHMTTKEHLLLYGQIKAPHWSPRELREQVRTILEETGMYAHRHKRVGTLSGGMKRKLSISIAFIGGSRLVVLDEPTTGVDPCSRRSIWDIVIQHKKHRTIIMSTHHLDEAEVLSDRIAFLERGGLKCCGSPFDLKDKLGQGYKLTLTKKMEKSESRRIDDAELKSFIQAHVPEARLKDTQGGDLVYSLPPFTSSNASTYRSLLTALDSNLDALQLGGYGISDTTLEEVFLQLTHNTDGEDGPLSISETVSDSASIDSFPSDLSESIPNFGDKIKLTSSSTVSGLALAWQQMTAILIKRFHHSRRDYKGLISQILLPVIFVVFAMGLGSIKNDLQHYPELELSPGLYNLGPSYSFFSNQNPSSNRLVDRMMSFPGIDNACLDKSNDKVCSRKTNSWISTGNRSKAFSVCKCPHREQICDADNFQPPHRSIPSSQVVYNLSGINVETYLVATANDFIRNRYGGFAFGSPLPPDLQMDVKIVPKNRTLSKVLYNPEGHHTMPAYLNSLNNLILRANLPADKDPRKYAISVSSHPYFGRADDEDAVVQGMLQILVAMCVLTGYSIMTASFAIYEVNEHHSGSKRLQHIAGISEPFYWTVNFIYDMTIYMIPVTLTVAVIAIFQIPAFTYRQNLAAVTLLLVLFGFSTFPWMYLLSGFFKDAEMAFITYVCLNLFLSINTIISTSILHFISQISQNHPEAIKAIFKKLCHAFLIFPQFNFGNGMLELARMNINVQLLLGYGVDAYKDPFSTDALGWMFISAFIQGLFFFSLRLLLNKSLIRKVRHLVLGRKTVPQVAYEDQDEDVATEHLRVSSGAASSDILQVNQLTKVYQHFKRKIPAVKRLSVGIPAGECFGLLGVNGAGKTTTFKMLTGDVSPTDGSAQIRDWEGRLVDIMECRNKGINIGYCPQQDALDHLLTGEEHLYFYARIRGISKKQIRGVVNYLLKRLELNFHRNIITDGYSCGTRRKLSTALALVGHPQILLLDEPSSGMDPRTKRHLWKIITEEVKGKCAVVLTSHSMEECEALCSRLAIMVKGQFQCLGSLQHIKNRFGSGFTVKMYLAEASCDAEAITGFMQGRFPSTYLKDQHSAMVEYHVPFAPGGVADIFYQLESNKNALRIKHFSVSQTTLDEVFINFAMGKNGMKTIAFDSEDEQDDLDTTKAVQT
ncbi:ATP-binding cassette sub-family A member 12 isoform X4 [Salarias fasciatus]|uniref:ATP-binding cassette sub-family A member 12 isoform X4 n=1 Tax=Salarias fasciatus TaxID=181472 RepID=UPI0011765E73|nr:ATP-binding cassette sub-family A member 12 isoform X4 [Salarias fasciatus]